ncbi:MAG: NAD(P)-dependent oxidoreductase [Hyphomicrobiaceae bacterium]
MTGTAEQTRIGFVGAGMMGHGICTNLLAAGHPLTVIAHRNRAPIDDLVGRGAREATSLAALGEASDVVMICVNSAEAVEAIVAGLRPGLARGSVIIDVTTSKPEVSRTLAAALASDGIAFVDAPVVGGPAHASQGKLGAFVGADDTAFARVRPILARYCTDIVHFGPPGSGNVAKLLNNFLTVGLRQLIVQAFRGARRHGIDTDKLYSLAAKGAAGSRTLDQLASGLARADYTQNKFSIANCHKDMSYAAALLADDPDGVAIQSVMQQAYSRFIDAGLGDRLASEMLDPALEARSRKS